MARRCKWQVVSMGVPPLLAHLFVFYFGTYSFLTPPVCLAIFTAASIAQAPILKTAFQAMRLVVTGYIVPFIFIYKPSMVLIGEPLEIGFSILDGVLAVLALAVATEGSFRRPLGWLERVLLIVACFSFFVLGWTSRVIGFAFLLLPLAYNFYVKDPSESGGSVAY